MSLQDAGDFDVEVASTTNGTRSRNSAKLAAFMDEARQQVALIKPGKGRRINCVTGEVYEAEFNADGKVKNKMKVGRGATEYLYYQALDAVGKADLQGRKLNINVVRLGIDGNPESPTYGQDITQFQISWGEKRPITAEARAGLNRRILEGQIKAVETTQKTLTNANNPVNKAAHDLAVAKLEYSKARIRSEYKPGDKALADKAELANQMVEELDKVLRDAKAAKASTSAEVEALMAELAGTDEPETPAETPAETPTPAPAAQKKAPATSR